MRISVRRYLFRSILCVHVIWFIGALLFLHTNDLSQTASNIDEQLPTTATTHNVNKSFQLNPIKGWGRIRP